MAKQIKITPISGSVEFIDDSTGEAINLELDGSGKLQVYSGSTGIFEIDPNTNRVSIDNDAQFTLPQLGIYPASNPQGAVWFDTAGDTMVAGTGTGNESLLGPSGPTGIQGPTAQGPTGIQGPRGPLGIQGPKGTQGPTGNRGPIGPGPQGPRGPRGPLGIQGPQGISGPRSNWSWPTRSYWP